MHDELTFIYLPLFFFTKEILEELKSIFCLIIAITSALCNPIHLYVLISSVNLIKEHSYIFLSAHKWI